MARAEWSHPDSGVRRADPSVAAAPRPRLAPAAGALTLPQTALEGGVATPLPVEVNAVAQEGDGATGRQGRQEAQEGADAGHPAAGVPRAERWARASERGEPGRPAGGVGAAHIPASGLPGRRATGIEASHHRCWRTEAEAKGPRGPGWETSPPPSNRALFKPRSVAPNSEPHLPNTPHPCPCAYDDTQSGTSQCVSNLVSWGTGSSLGLTVFPHLQIEVDAKRWSSSPELPGELLSPSRTP